MSTLNLTIKAEWFSLISRGIKTEEYREIKPYWIERLTWHEYHQKSKNELSLLHFKGTEVCKERFYEYVKFTNGYSKNSPSVTLECKGVSIGLGLLAWGAPEETLVFVIKLGGIIKP